MTSVQSKQDIDVAIFADFMAESIEKFNEFRRLGKAHTKNHVCVKAMDEIDWVPTDDPDAGPVFMNRFSVVNFRQTTFREVLPNMNGPIRAKAQTYGIAMLSILPGRHTPELVDYHTRGIMCHIELSCFQTAGGTTITGPGYLFSTRIQEEFDRACIKGFERDENINHLLIRFSQHKLTAWSLNEENICAGAAGAFSADYSQAITMAQG